MKKSVFLLCAAFCSLILMSLVNICVASPRPLQVAIMPVISYTNRYSDVRENLSKDLQQQMHLSLNDTLGYVDYIDNDKICLAMDESGFSINQNIDALKHTADLLNADVIVGYSIPMMYQQYYYAHSFGYDGGTLLQSYIHVKLWAYYRPLDKLIAISDKEQYLDSISSMGMLTELASDASYKLGKRADLKNLLKQSIDVVNTTASIDESTSSDSTATTDDVQKGESQS